MSDAWVLLPGGVGGLRAPEDPALRGSTLPENPRGYLGHKDGARGAGSPGRSDQQPAHVAHGKCVAVGAETGDHRIGTPLTKE